jgi:hypothetical protein
LVKKTWGIILKNKNLSMASLLKIIKYTQEKVLKNLKESSEIIQKIKDLNKKSEINFLNAKVFSDNIRNESLIIPESSYSNMKSGIKNLSEVIKKNIDKTRQLEEIIKNN